MSTYAPIDPLKMYNESFHLYSIILAGSGKGVARCSGCSRRICLRSLLSLLLDSLTLLG